MQTFKQFYLEAYQEIRPGVVQWVDDEPEEKYTFKKVTFIYGLGITSVINISPTTRSGKPLTNLNDIIKQVAEDIMIQAPDDVEYPAIKVDATSARIKNDDTSASGSVIAVLRDDNPWYDEIDRHRLWTRDKYREFKLALNAGLG